MFDFDKVFLAIVVSAVAYGWIEMWIDTHGFKWGPPNFLNYFIAGYHIPMAIILVVILYLAKRPELTTFWILMEDASYFTFNKNDSISEESWITGGWGGFRIFGQFIPWVYCILFSVWVLAEFVKWLVHINTLTSSGNFMIG